MRWNKKASIKSDKTETIRTPKRGVVGYSRKSALLEESITQMNAGKYGRSSAALKELLALDPVNMEARRLFATLHLRLGSLIPAREAFDALITEAFQRQDYWLAESLLREYLAAGPRCVPYLEKLGMIYQEKGNALEAVEEYGKAVDILMEDPDPERPDHAAQLYAKIRELAAASPVAFRLASFFDAATGELIPRQSSTVEIPSPLSQEVSEGSPREQTGYLGVGGAMPWDVHASPEVVKSPAEISHPLEIAQPETKSTSMAVPLQQTPVSDSDSIQLAGAVANQVEPAPIVTHPAETSRPLEIARSETKSADRAVSLQQPLVSDSDPVRLGSAAANQVEPTEIEAHPDDLTPLASQQGGMGSAAVEQRAVEEIDLSPGSVDPQAKMAVVPLEVIRDTTALDSSVVSQVLEQVSPEVPDTTSAMETPTASEAKRLDLRQTAEVSVSFSEGFAEPPLSSSPQAEDVLPLPSPELAPSEPMQVLNTEEAPFQTDKVERLQAGGHSNPSSVSIEPIHVPKKEEVPFQSKKVEALQPEESSSPTTLPIAPAQVSTDQVSQPWKSPGFSWKSLFDTAWKFGEPSAARDASTSPVPSPLDERVAEAPTVPVLQDQLVVDSARDTSEQGEVGREKDEETPRSPIAPMPWDQVQESVLSIPAPQTDSSIAAQIDPSVGQPLDSDRTPHADESQLQPSLSIHDAELESDSFSFASDAVTVQSEERQDSVVGEGAPSSPVQGTEKVVDTAPAFSFVRSSQEDEAVIPVSQIPEPQTCIQDPGLDPVVGQTEGRRDHTEFTIVRELARTETVIVEVGQGSKVELPTHDAKSVDEVTHENTEPIRSFALGPIEQSVTEMPTHDREAFPERPDASPALPHEDQSLTVVTIHTGFPVPESMPPQGERVEVEISIHSSQNHSASSTPPAGPTSAEQQEGMQSLPATHGAEEAFGESSRIRRMPEARTRIEEPVLSHKSTLTLNRVGGAITDFVCACFSTTQAIVRTVIGLAVLVGGGVALAIGALALTWMIMEEPPSSTFQSFTTTPQQTLSGAKNNAHTLLMGIDAPVGQDPLRAGQERLADIGDSTTALGCFGNPGPETGDRSTASASSIRGWVRGSDPIGQFKSHQETIQGWGGRHQVMLERYGQWQKLPFEDWGYGQPVSPPCGTMVFAHQLHVADGFMQGADVAVDRLETDMEMWRVVLGQARTLPVKMLALQAINDDIALASDMLVRSDFETKYLGRITKLVRPLDQAELSLRWPMQSELVSATKNYDNQVKAVRAEGQTMSAMVASALPLPKQRRLNDYAKYYEASYQATGEKQYGALPKWKDYVRVPATGVMDYLTNPIENLIGVEPLPAWDVYNGLIIDTDAHLRLASLQAWLRRGSSEGDLPSKIAKAGQGFYDPYTGLPLLVNQKKGVLYSVGHDGKDQDADPQVDVVVELPIGYTSASQTKSAASSSKSR